MSIRDSEIRVEIAEQELFLAKKELENKKRAESQEIKQFTDELKRKLQAMKSDEEREQYMKEMEDNLNNFMRKYKL